MHIDIERMILIVTGAHLRAEAGDRPLAERLRRVVVERLAALGHDEAPGRPRVLVCTDLWYLNDDPLRSLPTISVGAPGVNALTAFLADKLPSAFAIENVLLVQADLDYEDVVAACWGRDAAATASAIDAFSERYLGGFLEAAVRRWE